MKAFRGSAMYLAVWLIVLAPPPPWGRAETEVWQSWTASDGRVIEARFVRIEAESVVIAKEGKEFAVPFAKLADESVVLAKALASEPRATPKGMAPAQFLGKTFAECEAILGEADRVEEFDGDRPSISRYYNAPAPGVLRVRLERVANQNLSSAVPETVNFVWYYFYRGRVRTVGQCFGLTSTEFDGAYQLLNMSKEIQAEDVLSETHYVRMEGLPGRLIAGWEPAEFGKSRPPQYRHEHEDAVAFQKQRGLTTRERFNLMREKSALPGM